MDYWNTFLAWYIVSPNGIRNDYTFGQSMSKINDTYNTGVMYNTVQCNIETLRMQMMDSQIQNQAIINSLDRMNWYDTNYYEVERSVKVTDNIIEAETSLVPHDVKCKSDCTSKKKSIFDGILNFLEELVNELNVIIAYVLGDY